MAITALNSGESATAESVVSNDYKVNACDVDIDERCTKILALRQPTASDLRLVLAVIKTTADLERIGDEAKRVARMAIRAAGGDHGRNLFGQIAHLGTQVQQMLHGALDTFARMDVDAAIRVAHEDVNIDREYESIMRQSMTYMMEDPRSIPSVLDLIWAARARTDRRPLLQYLRIRHLFRQGERRATYQPRSDQEGVWGLVQGVPVPKHRDGFA